MVVDNRILFAAFIWLIITGVYFVIEGLMLLKISYNVVGVLTVVGSIILIVVSIIGIRKLCWDTKET